MKVISTALLFLISATVHAQLSYGPRLGLNLSKVKFTSDDFKTSYRPDFFIGGFANYLIQDKLSVQGELLFSREGGKEERISTATKGEIFFSYVQVPVLAKYSITDNFFAEAGPQIGFLVSAKETYDGSGKNDIREFYKSTDLRFPIGVGYMFTRSAVKGLQLNVRYSSSLSAVNKTPVGGNKLRVQLFSLGASFTL